MDWADCTHIISQLEEEDLLAIDEDLAADDDDETGHASWGMGAYGDPMADSPFTIYGKRHHTCTRISHIAAQNL